MEENFLLLFRFDNPLESSVEFMKVTFGGSRLGSDRSVADLARVRHRRQRLHRGRRAQGKELESRHATTNHISQNFLRDLLKEAKKINDVSEDKLIEYTDTMVKYPAGERSQVDESLAAPGVRLEQGRPAAALGDGQVWGPGGAGVGLICAFFAGCSRSKRIFSAGRSSR
jgi:hypothetical protein